MGCSFLCDLNIEYFGCKTILFLTNYSTTVANSATTNRTNSYTQGLNGHDSCFSRDIGTAVDLKTFLGTQLLVTSTKKWRRVPDDCIRSAVVSSCLP